MSNFESLMEDVLSFIDSKPTDEMIQNIKERGPEDGLDDFGFSKEV